MIYLDYVITIFDGVWYAHRQGTLVASGTKSQVFSVLG